jgi:hypothetical protein
MQPDYATGYAAMQEKRKALIRNTNAEKAAAKHKLLKEKDF